MKKIIETEFDKDVEEIRQYINFIVGHIRAIEFGKSIYFEPEIRYFRNMNFALRKALLSYTILLKALSGSKLTDISENPYYAFHCFKSEKDSFYTAIEAAEKKYYPYKSRRNKYDC